MPAADAFPRKPLRVVVSSTAGSANDVLVRLVVPRVTERLGQALVVDNRGGANGLQALNAVVQASPDGHTLLSAGNLLVLNGVLKRVPYDIRVALEPVAQLSFQPYLLLAHPGVPAGSLGELVAHAKAKPGALSYGSSGSGSVNHLGTALLAARAGVSWMHVPYKGNALAVPDLLAGRIDLLLASGVSALPHLKSGKLKALAVSSAGRSPAFPDVPTVAESGLPGYDVTNAYFMYVPRGTGEAQKLALNRAFVEAVHAPDVRSKLAATGIEPGERQEPAALRRVFLREYETWEAFVRSSGLSLAD